MIRRRLRTFAIAFKFVPALDGINDCTIFVVGFAALIALLCRATAYLIKRKISRHYPNSRIVLGKLSYPRNLLHSNPSRASGQSGLLLVLLTPRPLSLQGKGLGLSAISKTYLD